MSHNMTLTSAGLPDRLEYMPSGAEPHKRSDPDRDLWPYTHPGSHEKDETGLLARRMPDRTRDRTADTQPGPILSNRDLRQHQQHYQPQYRYHRWNIRNPRNPNPPMARPSSTRNSRRHRRHHRRHTRHKTQ